MRLLPTRETRLGCPSRYLIVWFCASLLAHSRADAGTFFVDIIDDEFAPKLLTVAPGDTVVWTNQTGSAHTVIADDGAFASTNSGQAFIPFGQSFSHTFLDPGRNPYYCQLHGGPGGQDMSGTIRVVTPGNNDAPSTPANALPAEGATAQSISPTLRSSAFADGDVGDVHVASQWIVRNLSANTTFDTGEDGVHKTSLPLAGLDFSTTYAWRVRYQDDRGGWSEYSAETQFTTVADQRVAGTGLTATYARYAAKTQAITVVSTRVDSTISFDWKLGRPEPRTPANHFYVRWDGRVLPEFSESYRFRVKADGGVRLWINGQAVINDWVTGPFALYRNNVVNLEAGVPATIRLEYFDTVGNASVSLRWSSRSQGVEIVPQARLFPLSQ